jgi:hypothetical protein
LEAANVEVATALKRLWELLVRRVGGNEMAPVPFEVNWEEFRWELSSSLAQTAQRRYLDWYGAFGMKRKPSEAGLDLDLNKVFGKTRSSKEGKVRA